MKKYLAILFAFITLISSFVGVFANESNSVEKSALSIHFNGEISDAKAVLQHDIYYLPIRKVFENMGGYVFYRSRDKQILILTRDGDMISHVVGDCTIVVNGTRKIYDVPSVIENGETYIPIDMIVPTLCPDGIIFENGYMNIQKYMFQSEYHKIIKDVLDVCESSSFYPEKFQRYINYHITMPSYSMQEVLYRVNLDLDYPFYENIATIQKPYDLLILVNKHHQLPTNFQQQNLVTMERKHTNGGGQFFLKDIAYEKYVEMSDAAKNDGVSMYVVSAYRTEAYQRNLYYGKVRNGGQTYADNYSARAGHSEHQTGLAVDINSTYVSFEYSLAFQWLQNHAHEYGYILRYPKGKEWITGYSYEPWHYRYVGVEVATIIHEQGITFEEYYADYVLANEYQ